MSADLSRFPKRKIPRNFVSWLVAALRVKVRRTTEVNSHKFPFQRPLTIHSRTAVPVSSIPTTSSSWQVPLIPTELLRRNLRSSGTLRSASSGNYIPTFRDNLQVPSSRPTKSKKKVSSWRWGKEVVPKRGYGISTTRSVILQTRTDLYFATDGCNHA